jgi:hypothetical protein
VPSWSFEPFFGSEQAAARISVLSINFNLCQTDEIIAHRFDTVFGV